MCKSCSKGSQVPAYLTLTPWPYGAIVLPFLEFHMNGIMWWVVLGFSGLFHPA